MRTLRDLMIALEKKGCIAQEPLPEKAADSLFKTEEETPTTKEEDPCHVTHNTKPS
jgi:hypothetical protein